MAVKLDAAKKETSVGWPQFLPDGKHYLYLLTGEKPEDSAYWIALDRLQREEDARAGADARAVRAARLSPLRARQDARRSAVRREGAQDDGRAGAARRKDRHGQRGPRALLGLEQRRARLPDRGVGRAPALAGPERARSSTRSASPGTTRTRRFSPVGRPGGVQHQRCPDRQGRHLDPRSRARRQLALHAGRRQQLSARLVARRRDDRLQLGPRAGRSISTRRRRRDPARRSFCFRATSRSRRRAGRRTESTSRSRAGARRRCGTCGRCRPSETASRFPIVVSPFVETQADVLARRALRRLRVDRVRPRGDLRPDLPGGRRQVAGLQRRRHRSELAGRRQGALLPFAGPEAHGGRSPRGRRLPGRRAPAALCRFACARATPRNKYAPSPDGQRFLFAAPLGRESMSPTTIVLNWPATLGKYAVSLTAGTRLGPYEIVAPIGAGGMGEVYKAKDTRLERTVAVKVLPQHLSVVAGDPAAVRARGEDDLAAVALEHLRAVRRRQRGRRRVPGDGAARGRDAFRSPRPRARCRWSRRCAFGDADHRRAGQGAPAGDRAPGPEARQRDDHEVGA